MFWFNNKFYKIRFFDVKFAFLNCNGYVFFINFFKIYLTWGRWHSGKRCAVGSPKQSGACQGCGFESYSPFPFPVAFYSPHKSQKGMQAPPSAVLKWPKGACQRQ